jgi:choline-sulfatase
MVRSERYKYIRFNLGEPREQLFDLELDPGEMRDLAAEVGSREILEQHRRMLDDYIAETVDFFPPSSAA